MSNLGKIEGRGEKTYSPSFLFYISERFESVFAFVGRI